VQDFARLIFVSSPIEGASFCKMSVAPLDVLTCQHTTLRITTFVAEALPPPELNPMHMRVHVSLREVIQDSLRGLPQQTPATISVPSYEVCPPNVSVSGNVYACQAAHALLTCDSTRTKDVQEKHTIYDAAPSEGPQLKVASKSVSLGCHFTIGATVTLKGLTMVPLYLHASLRLAVGGSHSRTALHR